MRAPSFWDGDGRELWPRLLAPAATLYAAATARRVARPGWRAPVPVLCCGNATAGGAGKTLLALELGHQLAALGLQAHVLTRGYGGRERGPLQVDPARHDAAAVGDEALLLAAERPTWVAADRAAGARAAVAEGAGALILDDGLQNPDLVKALSFLVIDGGSGFGNSRVIPAGPLRESPEAAARRAQAVVLIGDDRRGALAALPGAGVPGVLPVLRADLEAGPELAALRGRPVFAFCGIGRPEKFFDMLRAGGLALIGTAAFADHHPFRPAELAAILARCAAAGAVPVTTAKDAVRLPPACRAAFRVVTVRLVWAEPAALPRLLRSALPTAQVARAP